MLHSLLHLVATRPQLLTQHAEAYAELASDEASRLLQGWRRRALRWALALCALATAAVLAGVALMLWSVTPPAQMQVPWLLLAVPALPLALALWAIRSAQALPGEEGFAQLRQQLQADLGLLRQALAR